MYAVNKRSLFFAGMIFLWAWVEPLFPQSLCDQVQELLRHRIEEAGIPPSISVEEDRVHASLVLLHFYERRGFWPAWSGEKGLLPNVEILLRGIRKSEQEGLRPSDYHLEMIERILKKVKEDPDPHRLVDLDLLLTDAFLLYGSHLYSGRIHPETLDSDWTADRGEGDFAEVLETALDLDRMEETLRSLMPFQPGYWRLREVLAWYREIREKGGWGEVRFGQILLKGDWGERVLALRSRLLLSGDLEQEYNREEVCHVNDDLFDERLKEAVQRFQKRHGLTATGVVDSMTLVLLNIPVEAWIRQIELNLERWRWLPQDLGRRSVLVNIANYELDLLEDGRSSMRMRVVVGKPYRSTPVFSDEITHLVLNPYWSVPPTIAVEDILPIVQKKPEYLIEEKIKVLEGWGRETREVDPTTVSWKEVTPKNFRYRFLQEPGPRNRMGRIKFMFPNKYDIYLHDGPYQSLYLLSQRPFSSGCIRIEKPIEMALFLLKGDPQWDRESLLAEIEKAEEETVRLLEPVPIHVVYWTIWAEGDGTVQFRRNIYGRDEELDLALQVPPPSLRSY